MTENLDILAIGNALVDSFVNVSDQDLTSFGLNKGIMHLTDGERAAWLRDKTRPTRYVSGGSAANTAVGLAAFSGKAGFLGKLKNDGLGDMFVQALHERNVHYGLTPATSGPDTGSCLVMVTPDGERTMNTCLGAGQNLSKADIIAADDLIACAAITYIEGYLWDTEPLQESILEAATKAHRAGNQVAISLSDAFCVNRFRDTFRHLVANRTFNLVFANEDEVLALYETDDFNRACRQLSADSERAVVTRGAKGAIVLDNGETIEIAARPVDRIVDLTGAGDQFAAGFLYGYTQGFPHQISGQLGALAASEVIGHFGALPDTNYRHLGEKHGLLK